MFLPALRRQMRVARLREMKDQSYLNIVHPTLTQKKNMVLIGFRHVPWLKKFRWRKTWWTKTNFKGGTNEESHELEIPHDAIVGVYLKDLGEEAKRYIIK